MGCCLEFRLMKDVSANMISADYWINRSETAGCARMTEARIHFFNEDNINRLAGNNVLYDLAGLSDVYAYGVCVRRGIIWKEPAAYEPLSAIYVNEPVVILKEYGDWYKIRCVYYEGWINKECAGICSRGEWEKGINFKHFLVVTGDFIILPHISELSGLRLDMGVRLELVSHQKDSGLFYNYMVRVPCRAPNGRLKYVVTGIPVSEDVHVGYMEYTGANVLRLAFKTLGNVYGWGGSLYSRDCSALVMDVHRCFGLIMPRDVSGQMQMICCRTLNFSQDTDWFRLQAGDILGFPGHTMIYVGFKDTHYAISATGGFFQHAKPDDCCVNGGNLVEIRADSCIVSTFDVMRHNGRTWRESVSYAKLLRQW